MLVVGCRAHQLEHDQDQMRASLLNLYTNQIMDNLIRAHNGYPIVQLDYSRATGTITQNGSASFGGGQTVTDTRGGTLLIPTRLIQTAINYSLNGGQQNQLTVTAEPVLNNNEVYNAYLEFLKPDPERGPRLLVSCDEPPCGAAHLVRKCDDLYYWVPKEFAPDFLRLSLVTTVQRGQPFAIPRFYENIITQATITKRDPLPPEVAANATISIKLAKKVPNDDGGLYVSIDGKQARFVVKPVIDEDGRIDPLKMIDTLDIDYSTLDAGGPQIPVEAVVAQLFEAPVRIALTNNRPTVKSTEDLIEDLRSEMELLRLSGQSP